MIRLFEKAENDFTHNGMGLLDNYIIAPEVQEQLNGNFKLEFDYPKQSPKADDIIPDRIICCPVPGMDDQLFRIYELEYSLGTTFHVVAYHIFYDLSQNLIVDTNVVNKTGSQAIQQILNAGNFSHPFIGLSNISKINTARLVRKNIAEVLLDDGLDNSFISRWGGELTRDNFTIRMQTVRGSNNGVQIRDKKNLTGYKADIDYSPIVTRIMPMGFNGLLLPEKYVDSPLIGHYPTPRTQVMEYKDIKAAIGDNAEDEDAVPLETAYAQLRALAAGEYSKNHVDEPTASYTVSFAPLERTKEYKDFSVLETVALGDTVSVIHEEDGIKVTARVIAYKYNPLTKSYTSVDLGNATPSFTSIIKEIKTINTRIDDAEDNANYALQSANGKNRNFYGPNEPANPRSGDIWFKENGDKIEIWIYETRNGVTQWYQLAGDIVLEEMRQELERAAAEVEEANQKAEEALLAGQEAAQAGAEALAAGQAAQEAADDAAEVGANALAAGQAAQEAANQAQTDAANALTAANQAVEDATQAVTKASTAAGTAEEAYNKSVKASTVEYAMANNGTNPPATGWHASIPTEEHGSYLWTRTTFILQDDSTIVSYSVGTAADLSEIDINVQTITEVREQFYLSDVSTSPSGGSWGNSVPVWSAGKFYWTRIAATYDDGSVSYSVAVLAAALNQSLSTALAAQTATAEIQTRVDQHATLISLNASNITSLSGRIDTTEATLTIQAGQIQQKASQSSLDTLTGRVTNAEASITTQAGLIQSKASQSSVDTLTGRVTSAESKITQNATNINLRVSKNDVVNQINISNESILISGSKIHITGTTTIDSGIITSAMIANAAITNAKIADLAVNSAKIANLAVTNAKIGSAAVNSIKIADAAITTAKIANLAVTDAKIATLNANKITTGTLAAGRIAAGSITSDKLTIANGFIKTAMIADAAITNAKISYLDAAKITTGTLSAARIGANSITADKLAANAIQVGLAGWTSSIRISPTTIGWYSGTEKQGAITSSGLTFYYGTREIGSFSRLGAVQDNNIQGINMSLAYTGDYLTWSYQASSTSTTRTIQLTYDPRNKWGDGAGLSFGTNLRLNGYGLYTTGGRKLHIIDTTLSNNTTYPTIGVPSGGRICFGSGEVYIVVNGTNYNLRKMAEAIAMCVNRVGGAWKRPDNIASDGKVSNWTIYNNSGVSASLM